MNNAINLYWTRPSGCRSWSAWCWSEWRIYKSYRDEWTQVWEAGVRILGLEISWDELRGSTRKA